MAALLTNDWVENEARAKEVEHQTKIRLQEQREDRIERIDVVIQILYDMVWVGIIIGIWMALTTFVPVLELFWDILAVAGASYVVFRMMRNAYVTFIR